MEYRKEGLLGEVLSTLRENLVLLVGTVQFALQLVYDFSVISEKAFISRCLKD